jgi:hypothetical protein
MKKAAPKDPDYRAAWRACKEPWVGWTTVDLRKKLKQLLRSGWSIQALKGLRLLIGETNAATMLRTDRGVGLWHTPTAHCTGRKQPAGAVQGRPRTLLVREVKPHTAVLQARCRPVCWNYPASR